MKARISSRTLAKPHSHSRQVALLTSSWPCSGLIDTSVSGFLKPILIVGVSFAVLAAVATWFAVPEYGNDAYLACGLAGFIVWVAGSIGLALATLAPTAPARLNALLGGMLFRMALPLASLLILPRFFQRLADSGFPDFILMFFLVGLLIETPLLVGIIKRAQSAEQGETATKEQSSDHVVNGAAT